MQNATTGSSILSMLFTVSEPCNTITSNSIF
uniref:Uncharacterized protein n=1 Tax=Anguilla anguilla TaxID=7936 RepID=A0A0E9R3H9_ANGAN